MFPACSFLLCLPSPSLSRPSRSSAIVIFGETCLRILIQMNRLFNIPLEVSYSRSQQLDKIAERWIWFFLIVFSQFDWLPSLDICRGGLRALPILATTLKGSYIQRALKQMLYPGGFLPSSLPLFLPRVGRYSLGPLVMERNCD